MAVRAVATSLIDTILPRRCPVCSEVVGSHDGFCARCWGQLQFITPPLCVQCGEPFEITGAKDSRCGACIANPPPWAQARAVWHYDDGSRPVIAALKYADRTELAALLGATMARVGAELFADPDCFIVPVPLHRWRLLSRTYNQAALLARRIACDTGRPLLVDALIRRRATPPQQGLNRAKRLTNVATAFAIRPNCITKINNKIIILVDDVLTTGATLAACTRTLYKAGAREVRILTIARVVGPRFFPI